MIKIDWLVLKRTWPFLAAMIIGAILVLTEKLALKHQFLEWWWAELILMGGGMLGVLFTEAKYSNGSRLVRPERKYPSE